MVLEFLFRGSLEVKSWLVVRAEQLVLKLQLIIITTTKTACFHSACCVPVTILNALYELAH